jgi:hypothetical protein
MPQGDVSDGASCLADAITACGVTALLGRLRKHHWRDRPAPSALLACYASFAAARRQFGPTERMIIRELDISRLADPDWWSRAVLAVAEPEPSEALLAEAADLQAKLRLVTDTLPNLLADPAPEAVQPGTEMIQVMLPSEDAGPLHPLRLSSVIEAVCMLWNVVCDMVGTPAPLTLIACNTAPQLGITFRGAATPMAELRALLMQIWDGIVTHHDATLEQRLAAIPRSLPVVERIGASSQMVLAERRDLETGVRLFLEAGAYIPEMDDPARFTPARLLRVSPAMQGAGKPMRRRGDPPKSGIDDIVAEEREQLRQSMPGQPQWAGQSRPR